MSIFSKTPIYESVSYEEYDIAPTAESGMEIAFESAKEINNLIAGLYIADIMMEHAVYEGAMSDIESVMEASGKEFLTKVKNAFIKLRDKIVSWFKAVKTRVFTQFMNVGKFVNKYEKEIIDKAREVKFSYDGYKYKKSPADVGSTWISSLIDESYKIKVDINNNAYDEDKIKDLFEELDEKYSTAKIKEKIDDDCRDKESIEVNVAVAKNMISFVKNYDKDISKFTKNTDSVIKALNNAIKNIENLQKGIDRDSGADAEVQYNVITKKVDALKRLITAAQAINSYVLDVLKNMYSTYGSVLKKVFNKKAVKESSYFEESGDSLLEAAMKMI